MSKADGRNAVLLESDSIATLEKIIYEQDVTIARLSQSTSGLLFSEVFSDLVFLCPGDERIHAHRNIMAASSLYARDQLLQGSWSPNADERVAVVQMPQSATAVRVLLRFLYTGEVDAAAVEASLSEVLELATQHQLPRLTAFCEMHAPGALSTKTAAMVLLSAHRHNLQSLKSLVLENLVTYNTLDHFHQSVEFAEMKTTCLDLWQELITLWGLDGGEQCCVGNMSPLGEGGKKRKQT